MEVAMRVFVAGAGGAIGSALIPALRGYGHAVAGMTRSAEKAGRIRALGAEPVIADALDRTAVAAAVSAWRPDVVIHELTALPAAPDLRRFDAAFAVTNRLRTEGLEILIAAAEAAGARRFLAQSFAGWPFARTGGAVKTETDPLDTDPPPGFAETLRAIRFLETRVTGLTAMTGLVLRYGGFYGPGTGIAPEGTLVAALKRRRLPIVGTGGGVWSFIHIDDAAEATALAVECGAAGIYQIVDDAPAPVAEWLPALVAAAGAKPPRHVPAWLARLLIGRGGVLMMTAARGADNAKAKAALGWRLRWPHWREGFPAALGR
ncbi:MAG TPA: NAD(P)-dependent oxidoreductase [Dongiaceae bacterium]|nr:NAD(P)-dependent oxidoreductase [Dongiaceae bacterium]